VTEVYDLDAVLAERAPKEPFTFRFGGELFELPAEPDVRALAAFAGGRLDEAMKLLLGSDQHARMEAVDAVLDVGALTALLGKYGDHAGIELGG
jgi:hypothetical protein